MDGATETSGSDVGFKWDCPYCGESRINRSREDEGEENAVAALRAHIVASDGDGHGPQNESPEDGERSLIEYVRRVDGRG